MPTIGTVNTNALKKGNKNVRFNKKDYLSIPPSFLSFLVGFIDGDGYIQITKTTKLRYYHNCRPLRYIIKVNTRVYNRSIQYFTVLHWNNLSSRECYKCYLSIIKE